MASDQRRVGELYRQYGPAVYRRCLRMLSSADAAQDATQDVFLKLVRNMRKLEAREDVLPWIYQVTTHHCLNVVRNARRRSVLAADAEEPTWTPTDVSDRQLVRVALSAFDAATQIIAVAVLVDGMDHEEVAAALGVSRRTVARKLDRFLANARQAMAALQGA